MGENRFPGYRTFEKPAENPYRMRNIALRELRGDKEPNLNREERQKKSLRMLLPSWLEKRAVRDLEKMTDDGKD